MSGIIFIAEDGRCIEGLSALKASLAPHYDVSLLGKFAIESMGYIRIKSFGASCHLELRPLHVSELALVAAVEWLDSRQSGSVLVSLFDESTKRWSATLFPEKYAAIGMISAHIMDEAAIRERRIAVSDIDLCNLPATHPFAEALHLWRSIEPKGAQRLIQQTMDEHFGGRYALFRRTQANREIILEQLGPNKPESTKTWLAPIVGKPIRLQQDVHYGRSCANEFSKTLDRGLPVLQRVDALVDWPGQSNVRHTYKRLLLPIRTAEAEWLLSGALEDVVSETWRATIFSNV